MSGRAPCIASILKVHKHYFINGGKSPGAVLENGATLEGGAVFSLIIMFEWVPSCGHENGSTVEPPPPAINNDQSLRAYYQLIT